MSLHGVVKLVGQYRQFKDARELAKSPKDLFLSGLSGTLKSLFLAQHISQTKSNLIVTYSQAQADKMIQDLRSFWPDLEVAVFGPRELLPYEEAATAIDLRRSRLEALTLLKKPGGVVFAPIQAVCEALMPADVFWQNTIKLNMDSRVDITELAGQLSHIGYERVDMVEGPGQFSVRGGIVDVFPFSRVHPVRLEFFDDEIDSMRAFDTVSQRSQENIFSLEVPPARELIIPAEALDHVEERLSRAVEQHHKRLRESGKAEAAQRFLEKSRRHLELLAAKVYFPGIEQYLHYMYSPVSLLDYLPEKAQLYMDEPVRLREYAHAFWRDLGENVAAALEKGSVHPQATKLFWEWHDLWEKAKAYKKVFFSVLDKRIPGMEVTEIAISGRMPEHFHGNTEQLVKRINQWRRDHYRILLTAGNKDRTRRIWELLRDADIPASLEEDVTDQLKIGNVVVSVGQLETGFELPGFKLVALTELEIYGRQKTRRRRPQVEEGLRLTQDELRVGDYVVHVNHGIGQYLGVETMEVAGVHKDYFVVKYAGQDKLYVPTDQIDMLQRYVGLDEQAPRLSKLGGSEWARVKKRVKESVQEMAEGLIQLYAEREAIKGHEFPPDTPWQKEFEEAFPYEETPDQARAIEEVKKDMQRSRPMDRLLCGDVGYGKTEVAIRAAFKAVGDGKQVAVLVPTTILAQQHHRTFVERFEDYPVNIGVLSRFQSTAAQRKVLKGLANGSVDVVIGTHRLLSKDIQFKDLGLVIVDEEQRFGVAQKERLKEMCKNVDVLTLSATPIPRTLHMAMVGVRDMSLIETPPEDRFPIRTYVIEFDEQIIRQAILRELDRQGQVYFVYNRVQTIDKMLRDLQEIVPEARIGVAHGQMDERRLEETMLDFYNGEYDILLCTTIIETGMDISNVNTLIIYDADHLGLAQLYQLRGRVGRTNRVAYAYFTYRRDKNLSEDAEKRLQAIKEFTELGSGIKIAMRDLEIRGAGNILGPEQHGFIASVGFEMYCRLLEESIRELKGDVIQQPPEPVLDINVDAYISDEYVPDGKQKVELYKRIMDIRTIKEADQLEEEIEDRFGNPPQAVRNLVQIARIKVAARLAGAASVTMEKDLLILKLLEGLHIEREKYHDLIRKYQGKVSYTQGRQSQIRVRIRNMAGPQILEILLNILSDIGNR